MSKSFRRVVTGTDRAGKPIFTSDGEPVTLWRGPAGSAQAEVWRSEAVPCDLSADGAPKGYQQFPPPGGFVYRVAQLPPDAWGHTPQELASADFGMHQSDTLDIITVLSGEIWHKLRGSDEVLLKPGDTLVQRGTWHAWRNRSDQPCVMAVIKIGGAPPRAPPLSV